MADFMHRFLPESRIWIPKPTWANHHKCAHLLSQLCAAQDLHNALLMQEQPTRLALMASAEMSFMAVCSLDAHQCLALIQPAAGCSIWRDAQVQQEQYRYYKAETRGLDQEGLLEDLSKGKAGDVVLLHACAHNPTGASHRPSAILTRSLRVLLMPAPM